MTLSTPIPGTAPGLPKREPCALTDRGPRKIDGLLTAPDRLTAWADWFDLTPPPLRYSRNRAKDPNNLLMGDDLLTWMIASGGSLDWFLSGDARGLAVVYRKQEMALAEFKVALRGFDDTETAWLLDALKANQENGQPLDDALAEFKAKVESHRAARAA